MNRIIIIIIAVFLLVFTSCDNFLREKVYDFYTPENMYKTSQDAQAGIVGVYAPLLSTNLFRSEFFQLVDLDQDHGCAEGWIINNGFADGNWSNVNTKFKNAWEQLYIIIERANVVLDKVPGIQMDETLKNQILGEAYFLRSMSYFYLVRLWGRVPVRAARFSSENFSYSAPREDIKTIYEDFIIDGLIKAESLMQPKSSSLSLPVGRANRVAAKALLARVYLYIASASKTGASVWVKCGRQNSATAYQTSVVFSEVINVVKSSALAGYEEFNSYDYFVLARGKAGEIVSMEGTPDGYILKQNFMDVFKSVNTDHDENIFNISTSTNSVDLMTDFNQYYGYKGDQSPMTGYGRGYMFAGNSFYNSYKQEIYGSNDSEFTPENRHTRDARIEYGFKHYYLRGLNTDLTPKYWFFPQSEKALYPSPTFVTGNSDNDTGCTTKYDSYTGVMNLRYTDATISLIRYADILLMYAEALNETVGPTTPDPLGKTAIDYVNQVRVRSNAKPIDGAMECYDGAAYPLLSTTEGMRSFILEERGRELFYEMNRVFDLKRWGMYLNVMNTVNSIRTMNKRRFERHLLFPIPQEELRANTALDPTDNNGW